MKFLLLLLITDLLFAECYVVNSFKGKSFYKIDNFKLNDDKFSYPFEINIDGKNSSISNNILKISQISENALMGKFKDKNKIVIETWFVYPSSKKVIYTKSISGYELFNGSRMFIGNIVGTCAK